MAARVVLSLSGSGFLRPFPRARIGAMALAMAFAAAGTAGGEEGGAPVPAAPGVSTVGRELVDLYDHALASTAKVCEDYRRIRAMQLSQILDIPLSEAYENVQSVMPVFPPVDRDTLRRAIRDPADLKTHETEVLRIEKDVKDMVALVLKLLLEIERIRQEMLQHREHAEITLPELLNKDLLNLDAPPPPPPPDASEVAVPEADAKLAEFARHDDRHPAKDLTPLMERPVPQPEDLQPEDRKDERKLEFTPVSDPAVPQGAMRITPDNTLYGRRVTMEGVVKEWLFLDAWYTIGPFPNPARVNMDRKFPPETVIDLDATYVGKGNRLVRWQWHQARRPDVVPADPEEYAIWYAYTELYFDQPCDLWVAVGSDDKGRVWLNDQPIWVSNDQLKSWRPDEGFRKVHFPAGRNRILYRVENGWNDVRFSLGLRVQR